MSRKRKKRTRGGASQLCPSCGATTRVLVTRRTDGGEVLRKRQCQRHAGHRFTTRETAA